MDPVTTAIVAAVLADADEAERLSDENKEEIVDKYDDLVVLLEEAYALDSRLIEVLYQLEDDDTAAHRQMLHQEVKIVRADREPAIVQAAQQVLDTIAAQPGGDEIILRARTWQ
ncbi:MAG: hypothetical protein ACOC8X_00420 [Chloroflexota bacterium]